MSTTHPGVHTPTGPRCSWRGAPTGLGIVVTITATTTITTATKTEVTVASRSELRRCVGRLASEQLAQERDRKSTRLNSSHSQISYAVFCLKKKRSLLRRTYAARI